MKPTNNLREQSASREDHKSEATSPEVKSVTNKHYQTH